MQNYEKELAKLNGTLDALYDERVVALIRARYSINAELAILRKRDDRPEEFAAYNTFGIDKRDRGDAASGNRIHGKFL